MDGTLVQSEGCASQAIKNVVPALTDSVEVLTARYRGMRLAEIVADIERLFPESIPDQWLEKHRVQEERLASSMITPSVGVDLLLEQLTVQWCIASNAPVEKTRRSLELCNISHFFPDGIYSAYEVQAWKPDPTLFLHAAATQNVSPEDCLVLEDSLVGVQAAKAAGMDVVFYNPHGATDVPEGAVIISALSELLEFVA